jgi:hypothetical protein
VAEAALGATLLALLERLRLPSATWRAGRVLVAGGDLDQGLSRELGAGRTRSRRARSCSGGSCRPPTLKRFASESAERIAGNEMTLDVECVLDCGMDGQEPLC